MAGTGKESLEYVVYFFMWVEDSQYQTVNFKGMDDAAGKRTQQPLILKQPMHPKMIQQTAEAKSLAIVRLQTLPTRRCAQIYPKKGGEEAAT